MRLLITTDTVGGVWTYTRELCEGLLARKHTVLLVSMGRMPSRDQHAWARRLQAGAHGFFHFVSTEYPLEWMQENARCYSDAEPVLLRLIQSFEPDVLHLNQFCYGALPTPVPKVVIAHSDVISWSQACCACLPGLSPWFDRYLSMVRRGLADADAVVAPTQWMMGALASHYALPVQRAIIPNGRDLPASARRRPKKLQAVTVGRIWDEGKNVRMLEDVRAPLPLFVAGELALEDEPPFTSERLTLLGQLSADAALDLLAESAIYIATSRYEPFGLAPVEAALSGCAVLAHDIASLREVWGSSALFFKNAEQLTAHLVALASDPTLLARAARASGSRARLLYSQNTMIEHYLGLYAALGVPVFQSGASVVAEVEAAPVS